MCVRSLASKQKGMMQKMANSKGVLVKRFDELRKESGTGTGTRHNITYSRY